MTQLLDTVDDGAYHPSTKKKDERHWNRYWVPICTYLSTEPLRDYPKAVSGEDPQLKKREEHLLCMALVLIYNLMRPRKVTAPAPKPSSALAVLLGVRRVHKFVGAEMISLNSLMPTMKGLYRRFIQLHGVEALRVCQKAPLSYNILVAVLNVSVVKLGTRVWRATSLCGVSTRAVICLLYASGFRKAEVVSNDLDSHLTRANLKWYIQGEYRDNPTIHQLMSLREGDHVEVLPNHSKCDATGEVWGHRTTYHPYKKMIGNCCAALAELEIAYPITAGVRSKTALFTDDNGAVMTAGMAVAILTALLSQSIGKEESHRYSWHSFRIGLATRLGKAGCPDYMIQAFCRWQSIKSLQIYRRMGLTDYNEWLDKSFDKVVSPHEQTNVQIDSTYALENLMQHTDAQDGHMEAERSCDTDEAPAPVETSCPLDQPPSTLPVDPRSLTHNNAKGRKVMVPCYPNWDPHDLEFEGRGWAAIVKRMASKSIAVVQFLHVRDGGGRPYAVVKVPLSSLTPLV
jgi:site-specific recombinase XerD